ncbi:hypothetical protein CCMA1212_003901 [Trichoderma ghanense]|uniref:Uncharacterized protein n=1 Tax=Trichoderma ghanense TaxID=65468 RepID=A0ABY2HA15_9HYPO
MVAHAKATTSLSSPHCLFRSPVSGLGPTDSDIRSNHTPPRRSIPWLRGRRNTGHGNTPYACVFKCLRPCALPLRRTESIFVSTTTASLYYSAPGSATMQVPCSWCLAVQ